EVLLPVSGASLAMSPDGDTVAVGDWGGVVSLWDARSGKQLGHGWEAAHRQVETLTFSYDGRRLAAPSWENTAKIWDTASGGLLSVLSGHTGVVTSIDFNREGNL